MADDDTGSGTVEGRPADLRVGEPDVERSSGRPSDSTGRASRPRDPTGAGRRACLALLGVAAAVGALCLLDLLPALYALVLVVHGVLAWRRRPSAPVAPPDVVRVSPTPLGIVVFAVLWILVLLAVFLPSSSFRLLACLLFACAVAAWPVAAGNLGRARFARRIDARPTVGVPTTVDLVVSNPSRRPVEGLLVGADLGLLARPSTLETFVGAVRGASEVVARSTATFHRRGARRLRPLRVSSVHPFGILAATRETAAAVDVLVRPSELAPTHALLERLRGRARASVHARAALRAGDDELHGVRDHREGDDPRRIHARTSARRGAPTFVERREAPARRVVVALARARARDGATDAAFERAVSATAGLVRACARLGCATTLVLSDRDSADGPAALDVSPGAGISRALDALARVRSDGGRAPERTLTGRAGLAHGAILVWVSATPDGAESVPPLEPGADPRDRIRLRVDDASCARLVRGAP